MRKKQPRLIEEDEAASVGPIERKTPEQAAKHITQVVRIVWARVDTSWESWNRQLSEIMELQPWNYYPTVENPCGTLEAYFALLGIDPDRAINEQKYKELRSTPGPPPGTVNNPHGRNQHSDKEDNGDNCNNYPKEPKPQRERGNTFAYTVARLERDNPELAVKVTSGELSANAAAIQMGWRKPNQRMSLPPDAQDAGQYLAQRVDRAWMEEMLDVFYSQISD